MTDLSDAGREQEQAVRYICDNVGFHGKGAEDTKVSLVTEAEIGTQIAQAMAKGWFRRGDGMMYMFTGCRYVEVGDAALKTVIGEVLSRCGVGLVYQMNSVEKMAKRVMREFHIRKFSPSKGIVAFRNCVLELDGLVVHRHDERFETRIFLDFDYDASATCPRFERFLSEVISDETAIRVLQEFMGVVFVDRSVLNVEKILFLYGYGSNGKSVIHDMIKYVLGDNCSEYSLEQLCGKNNSDYYAAQANGKLLNFASDLGDADFSGGRFKAIVSHEPIVVRPIGMAPYQATEMPLLAANINKIPVTTDSSNGHWRRPIIIEFDRTIAEKDQDRSLKYKLQGEVSGVFNWIMQGRARIIASRGEFSESRGIDAALQRARVESNSVLGFLAEKGYSAKAAREGNSTFVKKHCLTLYREYQDYCREYGHTPKNSQNFRNDLRQIGFAYNQRVRIGGSVTSGFEFYVTEMDYMDMTEGADFPF